MAAWICRTFVPRCRAFLVLPLSRFSDSQREPLPNANWVGTVYHGLPPKLLESRFQPERRLAFLGRISPEKGPDIAIRLARGGRNAAAHSRQGAPRGQPLLRDKG